MALTTACARASLAGDEADHVKSRRKAALDYIDAHLGNAQLRPDEIAAAANVSRASLYRPLAAEGGIRAVLLKRRLDAALRLMLADNKDERSLAEIATRCGFVQRNNPLAQVEPTGPARSGHPRARLSTNAKPRTSLRSIRATIVRRSTPSWFGRADQNL